jgi:DNA-binding response OmpR family regulator
MDRTARLLVIDDTPQNARLLETMLAPHGYSVTLAHSGGEGLDKVRSEQPDLILLDILMPDMTGYDVCRRLREDPATRLLPVVMLTSSGDQDKVNAIEAGADDFIARPFNPQELLSRVRSLLRIKEYHDTIQAQAAELVEWNRTLEQRVQSQVAQLEGLDRLRRYFSAPVAEVIMSGGAQMLEPHRRDVTILFCDLRGFTAFSAYGNDRVSLRCTAARMTMGTYRRLASSTSRRHHCREAYVSVWTASSAGREPAASVITSANLAPSGISEASKNSFRPASSRRYRRIDVVISRPSCLA